MSESKEIYKTTIFLKVFYFIVRSFYQILFAQLIHILSAEHTIKNNVKEVKVISRVSQGQCSFWFFKHF